MQAECLPRLTAIGIEYADAVALRRIAMTLHRWHELECGDARGNAVERDEKTNKPHMTFDRGDGPRGRFPVADKETAALNRLKNIMSRYADKKLGYYVQGDPRGAALYILRPGDVRDGASVDSCYSNGIAVYK